jgi:transcriptional regulator with XRE-family HTH domain
MRIRVSPRESTLYTNIPVGMLGGMEWSVIRLAFIRARGTRTQGEIAAAGGLRQNAISKLESNDNLGPAVGTFVKAINGLGMSVSSFFSQIESGRVAAPTVQSTVSPEPSEQDAADDRAVLAELPPHAAASRSTMAVIDYLVEALVRARAAAKVRGSTSGDRLDSPGRHQRRVRHSRQNDRRPRKRGRGKE